MLPRRLKSVLYVDHVASGPDLFRVICDGDTERVRVLKALTTKGATLSQLARARLAFDGQAYVVFDGHDLLSCRDTSAAIAAVVRAKRPCAAVDLNAIRTAEAPE